MVSYGSVGFWAYLVPEPRILSRIPEWLSRKRVLLIIILASDNSSRAAVFFTIAGLEGECVESRVLLHEAEGATQLVNFSEIINIHTA